MTSLLDWVRKQPPQNRQGVGRIFQSGVGPYLLTRKKEQLGLTMVGVDSTGDWTLYLVRTVELAPGGAGSGVIIPPVTMDIKTGDIFKSVSMQWPSRAKSQTAEFYLRRGVALHMTATEMIANVEYRVNDYAPTAAGIINDDYVTAWIAPGTPIFQWLPDVLVGPAVVTLDDAKTIPLFARQLRARVRDGSPAMTITWTNPEGGTADVVTVPADGQDHTYLVPGDCTLVLASSADPAGSVAYVQWECIS